MPAVDESNRLHSILGGMREYDKYNQRDMKALTNGVLFIYKDLYYTNKGWVKHLSFDLNKVSRHLGLTDQKPAVMNIANNVMMKRFGVGNQHEILDVHSNISVVKNRPLVMITVKYI